MAPKYKLFFDSSSESSLAKAESLRRHLEELRVKDVEIVDTASMTEQERFKAYSQALPAAISKHISIRQTFGSRSTPGFMFGKEPALLVYENGKLADVLPHKVKGRGRVEIEEYLTDGRRSDAF
jgi:hypothetical protein